MRKKILTLLMIIFMCLGVTQTGMNVEAAENWWKSDVETSNACRYLIRNLGYSKYAAAGILGNFRHESNINPYIRERIGNHYIYPLGKDLADRLDPDNNGFGPGWGLAQWGDGSGKGGLGSGRWIELLNFVNARYKTRYSASFNDSYRYGNTGNEQSVRGNIPNLYQQLDFVRYEMRDGSGYVTQNELNLKRSVEEASDTVLYRYEYAGTKTKEQRRQNARDIYQYNCSNWGGWDYYSSALKDGWMDTLDVKAGRLNISGWHVSAKASERHLRYLLIMDAETNKEIKRVPIFNVARPDVGSLFPKISSSKASGFSVSVPITKELKNKKIFVITRYIVHSNSNEILDDMWFKNNQIKIPA